MIWWILVDSIIWLCIPVVKNYFACRWMDKAYTMTDNFAVCLLISIYMMITLDHMNEGRFIMIDLIIGIIQASLFIFAAFLFGYTKGMNEKATDEVKRLQRAAVEEASDMRDSVHSMNRLVNVILASVARNHNNPNYPIDSQATNQILRRASMEGYRPDNDTHVIAEELPLRWGHWLSNPDESGYITPSGLTQDRDVAERWRVIGQRVHESLNELREAMNMGPTSDSNEAFIPQMVVTSITPDGTKHHTQVKPKFETKRTSARTTTNAEFDL